MNILYIAYSCNPFAGSEDKIGWCVPYESSKTNKVYVITKEEQREPVEKYLQSHPLENIRTIQKENTEATTFTVAASFSNNQ